MEENYRNWTCSWYVRDEKHTTTLFIKPEGMKKLGPKYWKLWRGCLDHMAHDGGPVSGSFQKRHENLDPIIDR
jgi:hypothetical protein